jgi:hypothetical protein
MAGIAHGASPTRTFRFVANAPGSMAGIVSGACFTKYRWLDSVVSTLLATASQEISSVEQKKVVIVSAIKREQMAGQHREHPVRKCFSLSEWKVPPTTRQRSISMVRAVPG